MSKIPDYIFKNEEPKELFEKIAQNIVLGSNYEVSMVDPVTGEVDSALAILVEDVVIEGVLSAEYLVDKGFKIQTSANGDYFIGDFFSNDLSIHLYKSQIKNETLYVSGITISIDGNRLKSLLNSQANSILKSLFV